MDYQQHPDILSQLPLSPKEVELLRENGFDDIDSLRFLDINTLVALKIEEPEELLKAIQDIITQIYEEGGAEYDEEEDAGDQEQEEEELKRGQEEQQPINIETRPLKQVTAAMIVQTLQQQRDKLSKSAAAQLSKELSRGGPNLEATLSKLTHLQLNNKKIQVIGEEMQKYCKNAKVLYLFDNYLTHLDGLSHLKNLIQLSLYNNQLTQMVGLDGLTSLRKLYLERNRISRLEGITDCRKLEELYLSHQDIQEDFTFDEYSLAAVAGSLRYLDLADCRVAESKPLYYLERVEVLILKANRIIDFEDQVCPMLQTMSGLRQLDLSENPVNGIQKYRDQIIILTGNRLEEIDGKKVTQQERTYLMQLVQRKQRQVIGSTPIEGKKEEKKGTFEIQGKNKTLHQNSGVQSSMAGTYGGGSGMDEEGYTQNQFYSPLMEDTKNILKQRTNISNPSFQGNAGMKKRSANLNSNSDFTAAGVSHMPTKHVPMSKK